MLGQFLPSCVCVSLIADICGPGVCQLTNINIPNTTFCSPHNNLSLLWGSPTCIPPPPYSCMVWNQNCWCFLQQCKKICNINLFSKIAERIHPFLRRQAPWGALQDRGGQASGYWGVMLWGQVWVPATCRATQWPCDRMWGFVRRLSGRPSAIHTLESNVSQILNWFDEV